MLKNIEVKPNSASNDRKRHSIGIARSEKPEGPFTDVMDRPLLAPDYSVIDASLFFDDDGRIYLYYSRDNSENWIDGKRVSQSYGVELNSELTAPVGEPVLLTTPTNDWELISGSVIWNEGPCVFKRNGKYYMLFSANYYASVHYCVGYAISDGPLGNFVKPADNPIVKATGLLPRARDVVISRSRPTARKLISFTILTPALRIPIIPSPTARPAAIS